jgi:uncharacterized Zn-binding protein involved in type VI secretion
MANIVLNGDMSAGHSGWVAVPVTASSNVTINGKTIALNGDSYASHTNSAGVTHTPKGVASSSVTINGVTILMDGDALSCGDTAKATSHVSIN